MGAYSKIVPGPPGCDLYWANEEHASNFAAKYGTVQYMPLRSRTNPNYVAGFAISAGVPTDDDEHDNVPVSTIIFNPDGGNGTTLYVKNDAGAVDGIAAITDGVDA